jgi:diguanylate cyclase (GGDEF)-like protein
MVPRLSFRVLIFSLALLLLTASHFGAMVLILWDAGASDRLFLGASRIRAGVHRFAKLEIAEHPSTAEEVGKRIESEWRMIPEKPRPFSLYREQQESFLLDFNRLRPIWARIKMDAQRFRADPSPAHREALLASSEDFWKAQEVVAEFVDELKIRKRLLFGGMVLLAFLMVLGVLVILVVNHREIRGRLEPQATLDSLTGVLNRGAFTARMAKRAHPGVGAILMLDIDLFKQVNDRYGHQAGDEVLRLLGDILRRSVRDEDFVGRVGGEEFALWLPGQSLSNALEVAERIRDLVGRTPFPIAGSVTVSIGISLLHPSMSWEHAQKRADEALYRAKAQGRNRVLFSPEPA